VAASREVLVMIYIVDNGQDYSDHRMYFVEAPQDFGQWWREKFEPWAKLPSDWRYGVCDLSIVGVAPSVDWWHGGSYPVVDWLREHIASDDWCETEEGETPRPRYRLEAEGK
jgi:hypothetical protein